MEAQGLKDVANQALIGLIQSVTEAMTFLKGEIPIAVRELLTYYTAYHILLCVFATAIAVTGPLLGRKFWKKYQVSTTDRPSYSMDGDGWMFGSVLCYAVPTVFGVVILGINLAALLKVTSAPRIWLIEYAASLVK